MHKYNALINALKVVNYIKLKTVDFMRMILMTRYAAV